MSMTYIQLIQQCTVAIWGGGVTLNFYLDRHGIHSWRRLRLLDTLRRERDVVRPYTHFICYCLMLMFLNDHYYASVVDR